jgi:hypothetical protein
MALYGCMRGFVIYVNECSFDIRKDLHLILQVLAEIVRFPQGRASVHHNVYFNEEILEPKMLLINQGRLQQRTGPLCRRV